MIHLKHDVCLSWTERGKHTPCVHDKEKVATFVIEDRLQTLSPVSDSLSVLEFMVLWVMNCYVMKNIPFLQLEMLAVYVSV